MRVLAALALVLLAACTGGSEPAPEPAAQGWSVRLSTAPTLLALGPDDVWAASYGNGVGGSQVYRVDRTTGRLAAQRTVAGQPNGLAAAPDGALWLSTVRLPDQPSGTGLQVLDPVTLQTRRAVPVPRVPLGLAFADGALWVGEQAGVRRLGGPLVRTPEPAYRLLPLRPGRLLVVGASTLAVLDTAAGRLVAQRAVPSAGSLTATADASGAWVVAPDAQDRSVLRRYDASLVSGAQPASPGRAGAVAALGPDALWVTDPGGGRLLCADPASGAVRGTRQVAVSGPLVADARAVVVAEATGLRSLPPDC